MVNNNSDIKNPRRIIVLRVWIVSIIFLLIGVLIIYKIVRVQFVEKKQLASLTNSNKLRDTIVMPVRGNILTWDGKLLATSIPSYDIRIDFRGAAWDDKNTGNNIDTLSIDLAGLFKDKSPRDYKILLNDAKDKKNKYFTLKNEIDHDQLKVLKKFPILRLDMYKSGLYVIEKSKRSQPFQPLAKRIIGPNFLERGKYGIEYSFDNFLAGKTGRRLEQKIGGTWIPVNHENEQDPVDGNDIITSIDIKIQDLTEKALQDGMELHKADTGCAVVMEVQTGKIVAIANLTRKNDGRYVEDFNYAFESRSEPGSTFKLVSAILLLENNFVNPKTEIDTRNGEWFIYGDTIRDTKKGGYGRITFKQAFELSSNVAFAKLVNSYFTGKKDLFYEGLEKLHLTDSLKIDIKGECPPKIEESSKWVKSTLVFMSHGYGIDLSPLHILTLYNAVANQGKMVKPMFVTEVRHAGQTIVKFSPEVLVDKICSDKTLSTLQSFLTGVVESGTAKNIMTDRYQIAGKTGTAQKLIKKRYQKIYRASFVGYFPVDHPKYSCIVVIDNPKGGDIYGAKVAAPVFREIADKLYGSEIKQPLPIISEQPSLVDRIDLITKGAWQDYISLGKSMGLNIQGNSDTNEWAMLNNTSGKLQPVSWKFNENTVPDVRGMLLTDAVYILENLGFNVECPGYGRVLKQSIQPGKKIKSKITIRLTLDKT